MTLKKYLLFMVSLVGGMILLGCEKELSAEEVLNHSIEAMSEVDNYEVNIKAISKEGKGEEMVIENNGTINVSPSSGHLEVVNKSEEEETHTEVYFSEDSSYYKGKNQWIHLPQQIKGLKPVRELEVIKKYLNEFSFSETKDNYHFSLSTKDKEFKNFIELFPYFYFIEDPFFESLLRAYREERSVTDFHYEFAIDKESFLRTSAKISHIFDADVPGFEEVSQFKEQLVISYDSYNEEEILIPKEVSEGGVSFAEYLLGPIEAEENEASTSENTEWEDATRGITDGNHFNGANFVSDKEWIYYTNYFMDGAGIFRMKPNGEGLEKISDVAALNLNVTDSWIYYTDPTDGSNIYRMKNDGSTIERLVYTYALGLRVTDDWMYYVQRTQDSETTTLVKTKKEGNATTSFELANDAFRFTIYQDKVIYQTQQDFKLIVSGMENSNERPQILVHDKTGMFNVENGWVYFENKDKESTLHRIRLDGTVEEQLTEVESQGFNVSGDYLYYTNMSDDMGLYQLDLNTLEEVKLDKRGSHIHVAHDSIFYSKHINSLDLGWFKMKKGSQNSQRIIIE
jgi:hypothetical protein